MKFRALPVAEQEALASALWYEDQQKGLGDSFTTALDAAFASLREHPHRAPRAEYYRGRHELRRILLHGFPYVVVYACRETEIIVVAVAHLKRRPRYWLARLDYI